MHKLLRAPLCKAGMQRPRHNRLSEGSYAEQDEDEDVELVDDVSDDEFDYESADSDDEFVEEAPVVEVDRCELYYIFLHYFFLHYVT